MEYAEGVKNTRIGVAEIVPNTGKIVKTTIPNISSIRSIQYYADQMRIFRASGIGQGTMIPYKQLEFESNMRLVSPFITPIDNQQANVVPKSRSDRRYHNLSICPIPGCQSSFETAEELDVHIAANIHTIAEMERRSSNDVARIQLIEAVRSTTTFMRRQD
ncbi:unnamed protein product, partial [Rotaria sp. Silwood1]